MYTSHYGLKKKPFRITSDPDFLWMGTKHREALATLKYGVMDNNGFLLLTGDVGTGKTTVINRLMADIKGKVYTAKIPDPRLTKYDFYRMVSRYFKLPIDVRTKRDFIEPFTRFLTDAHQEKKSVFLIIDEAQRLKHDLMEEIRLLSNLEYRDSRLLNIFFVGQNEFNHTLLKPENRALLRRITITFNLDPLTQTETGAYIAHRLEVAGADHPVFSAGAIAEIYDFSNGFPRQINIICDLAMFFAYQLDQRTISRRVVRQCRERIAFSGTDTPAALRPQGADAPAMTTPAAAPVNARLSVFSLWLAIAAALLLVLGTGLYFITPEWKARARRWIHQIGQSEINPAVQQTPASLAVSAQPPTAPRIPLRQPGR